MIMQVKPVILIRTDGDNKIGMGHIYRTISLSQELKKHGFKIHFLISKNDILFKKLQKHGKCHISNNNEITEIDKIKKINPDIIIIDILKKFFSFGSRYMKKIQKFCKLLITIDYVAKELQHVDIAIHSLFGPKQYTAKKTFFDLKYAMVRKDFFQKSNSFKITKQANTVLILQGGADTRCFSPKILKSFNTIKKSLKITIVLGPAFECWDELDKQLRISKHKTTVFHNVTNIKKIMLDNQVAVTAGGNTMLELLSLGVPSIVICAEKHEVEAAKLIQKKGIAINLGYNPILNEEKISDTVLTLLDNFKLRKKLTMKSRKVIDTKGIERISNLILNNYNLIKKTES